MPARSPRRPGRLQRIIARFGFGSGGHPSAPSKPEGDQDWAPGDMAENVSARYWHRFASLLAEPGPELHAVYPVAEVRLAFDPSTGRHVPYLAFARFGPRLYIARHFRKITPHADAVRAADAAFTRKLKRGRLPAPALIDRIAASLKGRPS